MEINIAMKEVRKADKMWLFAAFIIESVHSSRVNYIAKISIADSSKRENIKPLSSAEF